MINYRYLMSLSLATTPLFSAQNILCAQEVALPDRQVTVTRDYVPEVHSIVKLDAQPAPDKPAVERREADFHTTEIKTSEQRDYEVMSAEQVFATPSKYTTGWVRADFGNYTNGNLDASARFNGFQIDLAGTSFCSDQIGWYDHAAEAFGVQKGTDLSLLPGEHWDKAMLINGKARVSYDYTFLNDSKLKLYVGARGQKNYMPSSQYKISSSSTNLTLDSLITGNTKQRFGAIDAGASYTFENMKISADYTRSGVRLPDWENLTPNLVDHDLHLSGEYGWYEDPQWRGKASLTLGGQWDNDFHFTILGEGEISYIPNTSELNRYYARFRLGTERPALFDLMAKSPLLFPIDSRTYIPYRNEEKLFECYKSPTLAHATFGYESNEQGNFQWGIYAGVQQTWNRLATVMMVHPLSQYTNIEKYGRPLTPGDEHQGPYQRLVSHDCIQFPIGVHAAYELNRFFSATFDGEARLHSCSVADIDDSHFNCDVHLKSNPIKALQLDLSFVGRFLREGTLSHNYDYPKHSAYSEEINLHNITDINFDAEYNLMDNLSVYGSVRNLLCQRYELWPGIPAQKLNFHIGAQLRF